MKTTPVSLIVAGLLVPVVSMAQPAGGPEAPPRRDGEAGRGGQRAFTEGWKAADADHDGTISRQEFDAMPRIQNLPAEKRTGLFKHLDKDADGTLSRKELGRIGRPRDGQESPMLRLWELDVDKSGGVTFKEFKRGRFFKKLPPEKQEAVFRRLDTNGDGAITPQDKPEPPMEREGGKRPNRPDGPRMEPRQIIRQLDKDADGKLSFEEFRAGPDVRNLSEDEQEDRFEALDRNNDQKISAADFPPPFHGGEKRPQGPPPPTE